MKSLRDEEKELARQKKISFNSGQNRLIFPSDLPVDRFGAGLGAAGDPKLGPASYNVDEKTSIYYNSKNLPVSKLGYSLAARTSSRVPAVFIDRIPGPGAYEIKDSVTILKSRNQPHENFRKKAKAQPPFQTGTERLKKQITTADETFGPAGYNQEFDRNRHVVWEGSFGGQPLNLPVVDHQSFIPSNTDKLLSAVENKRFNRRLAYLKLYYGNDRSTSDKIGSSSAPSPSTKLVKLVEVENK